MSTTPINRTIFLTDGFNLYHSIKRAEHDLRYLRREVPSMRWLDLHTLCSSYLYRIGGNAQIEGIYYFSALATHLVAKKPDVVVRHQMLIDAMAASGVVIELGRFKQKAIWCDFCRKENIKYEEKETDVAISVKLIELLSTNACDTAVIVSGDTDIAPAVRMAQRLFPSKQVMFAFPYARKNKELAHLAPSSFNLSKEQYAKYQFADPLVLLDGRTLRKPASW